MNAKLLVDKWLTYATTNNIRVGSTPGRPAEDVDLLAFLKAQGVNTSSVEKLIAELPEPEPAAEIEPEQEDEPVDSPEAEYLDIPTATRLVGSDKKKYVWIGNRWLNDNDMSHATTEVSNDLTKQYRDKNAPEDEPVDSPEDEPVDSPEDEPVDSPEAEPEAEEEEEELDNSSLDAFDEDDLSDKQIDYLNRIKVIIKKMTKEQKRQLRREIE